MKVAEPTFCGVPSVSELAGTDADVVVYSAADCSPYQAGVSSHAAEAPGAIRGALGWHSITRTRWDFDVGMPIMGSASVADYGAVPTDPVAPEDNRAAIEATTRDVIRAGAMPVVLGGDDSVPIPFLSGLAALGEPVTIVQLDAHIDWRDALEGNRFGYSSTMRRASEMAHVGGIIQVGIRGPGSAGADEVAFAQDRGAKILQMAKLHADGIGAAIEAVPHGANVVFCVDVDGFDKCNVVGANFVEFVPGRDPTGEGAKAIARLICCLIARATQR